MTSCNFANGPKKAWCSNDNATVNFEEYVCDNSNISIFPECPEVENINIETDDFRPKHRCGQINNSTSQYKNGSDLSNEEKTTSQTKEVNQKQPLKRKRKKVVPLPTSLKNPMRPL